jgi:anti-sigma B factor antagonist
VTRTAAAARTTARSEKIKKDQKVSERSVVLRSGQEVTQVPETSFPVELIEGVPVVTAPEEVDLANAALLQEALAEAAGPGQALVVVDMSRTRFCDSAGLNALVAANRRARAEGGEVRLVVTGESVIRIFQLTGVDRVVPVYASLEEALT